VKLAGRRIVITGASRGVGYAIARRILPQGARVLGVAKDAARLRMAAESLRGARKFTPLVADLSDPGAPGVRVAGIAS
jgi:NAD(P)-dependent dehydrogenase (short-subunit alcohol dehydrogenase family)